MKSLRVECKISFEYKEPYAVIYTDKMTDSVARAVSALENENDDTCVLIGTKDRKTYFIKPEEITLVRTEGRDVVCYDRKSIRYVLDKHLYELEGFLNSGFVRISKSAIVNISEIDHARASFNGTMEIVMKNGLNDYISRSFRKGFKERLGLK